MLVIFKDGRDVITDGICHIGVGGIGQYLYGCLFFFNEMTPKIVFKLKYGFYLSFFEYGFYGRLLLNDIYNAKMLWRSNFIDDFFGSNIIGLV